MQARAVAKKEAAEDQYFFQCQQEQKRQRGGPPTASEAELFQKQGAQGINFVTAAAPFASAFEGSPRKRLHRTTMTKSMSRSRGRARRTARR